MPDLPPRQSDSFIPPRDRFGSCSFVELWSFHAAHAEYCLRVARQAGEHIVRASDRIDLIPDH